jgi:hypothetical protein
MTTATLPFSQPTLFREGRSPRPQHDAPGPRRAPDATPASPRERDVTAPHPAPPAANAPGARPTLDDVLTAAWDGLAGHHSVTCPVCTGPMAPRYGSGAKPVGGRCTRCGSTLG